MQGRDRGKRLGVAEDGSRLTSGMGSAILFKTPYFQLFAATVPNRSPKRNIAIMLAGGVIENG
jgi:hypothetical protein